MPEICHTLQIKHSVFLTGLPMLDLRCDVTVLYSRIKRVAGIAPLAFFLHMT